MRNFTNEMHLKSPPKLLSKSRNLYLPVWEIAKVERGGPKTAVLDPPLTFPISQRVLKIFYSFLVQIISIFYSGFISNKIFGARALPRALRARIFWRFQEKNVKNDENWKFSHFQIHLQRLQTLTIKIFLWIQILWIK